MRSVGNVQASADHHQTVLQKTKSNYDWMEETMARLDRTLAILARRLDSNGDPALVASVSRTYIA